MTSGDEDAPEDLAGILAMANEMEPDEFLDLLYDVAADLVQEGCSLDEAAAVCERICARLTKTRRLN